MISSTLSIYLRQQCSEHNPHLKHGDVQVAAVTPLQGFRQLSPMEMIENKIKSTKIDVFMIILSSWLYIPSPEFPPYLYMEKNLGQIHLYIFN